MLEGQVVELGVVAAGAGRGCLTTGTHGGTGLARWSGEGAVLLTSAPLEVDDAVGRDLERGPRLAVAALELAGPETALDEDLVALAQVLGHPLGAVAPDSHPEPVGLLDPLAGLLVLRALVDGHVELRHGPAVGRVAHLRVG